MHRAVRCLLDYGEKPKIYNSIMYLSGLLIRLESGWNHDTYLNSILYYVPYICICTVEEMEGMEGISK